MNDFDTSQAQAPPFLQAWESYAAACQTLFERLSDGSAAQAGALPLPFLEPWKDFAAKLGMGADFAAGQHFKPEDLLPRHLPALGYSREYQEIVRRMVDLCEQFQRRCADIAQTGADIGQSALQAIQKRSSGDAALLGSPAALYDAWIDCAEEAFARAAHGEPFARLLADLCNLLSAFKVERGKLLEALARHLDLPSRAEVDSLHRQVRALTAGAGAATAVADAAVTGAKAKTNPQAESSPKNEAKPKVEASPRAMARKKVKAMPKAKAKPPARAARAAKGKARKRASK